MMVQTDANLNRYVTAFVGGNYSECVSLIPLLDDATPVLFRLIGFICVRKTHGQKTLDAIFEQLGRTAFADAFIGELAMLVLKKKSVSLVLAAAKDEGEMCHAHFLAAEVAVEEESYDVAIEYLQKCVNSSAEGYPKQIAEWHLPRITNLAVVRAFENRNYRLAADLSLKSGSMGAEGLAISFLSMHRLGSFSTGSRFDKDLSDGNTWENAALKVVTGSTSLEEALKSAREPEERCFILLCHGARARTLGQKEVAQKSLSACLEIRVECTGARLARTELASLLL